MFVCETSNRSNPVEFATTTQPRTPERGCGGVVTIHLLVPSRWSLQAQKFKQKEGVTDVGIVPVVGE